MRIKEQVELAGVKGRSMVWLTGNNKVKRYLKHQMINLRKEHMMKAVKENCTRLRTFFEARGDPNELREQLEK